MRVIEHRKIHCALIITGTLIMHQANFGILPTLSQLQHECSDLATRTVEYRAIPTAELPAKEEHSYRHYSQQERQSRKKTVLVSFLLLIIMVSE